MTDQDEDAEIEVRIVEQFRVRSDPKIPHDAVLVQFLGSAANEWYLLQASQVDDLVRELQGWRDWMKKKMS